jgi:hypothetical protein
MATFSCPDASKAPVWSSAEFARWKMLPERFGGGWAFIRAFKDGWIRFNRFRIRSAAAAHSIQEELLGGTAWIEVGGDPAFIDQVAFRVRRAAGSGPEWIERHLTKPALETSFGPVSMQLRTAAETMGLDPQSLTGDELEVLGRCLERDVFNLDVVAMHLHQLARFDDPKCNTLELTEDQIRLVGARYNRGKRPTLAQIKKNTSYGDVIVKIWKRIGLLLH